MRMLHTVHLQRFHGDGGGDEGEEEVAAAAAGWTVAPTVAGMAEASGDGSGGGLSLEDAANASYGGNWTGGAGPGGRAPAASVFESNLIIPLYVIIFVLAIVGNSLVLATLAQNKRMRTVTNVYLLNLIPL
ncbi:Uncharacterized protein GBIM_11315 [Gryllus bimaculatus]|nr:Uncharacterized protein GBIM_11315 [Gryllus bimaculatus]